MKKIIVLIFLSFLNFNVANAGGWSMATGVFDYSDDKKRSGYLESTYSFSENKSVDTILGKIIPIAGGLITDDSAAMAYVGGKINYTFGNFVISPSFTPGFYSDGDGKDLGNALEFKSQVNLGWNYGSNSNMSFSYSHISNASLGDKNPGANNIAFTFYKQY